MLRHLVPHFVRPLAFLAGLAAVAVPAAAQQRGTAGAAVSIYNANGTTRVVGAYEVAAGTIVPGTVGVLNGPVVVAGRVNGTLVAINADVRLAATARIVGDLIVVGGTVRREEGVIIGGEVRTQAELLHYTMEGDLIVTDDATSATGGRALAAARGRTGGPRTPSRCSWRRGRTIAWRASPSSLARASAARRTGGGSRSRRWAWCAPPSRCAGTAGRSATTRGPSSGSVWTRGS